MTKWTPEPWDCGETPGGENNEGGWWIRSLPAERDIADTLEQEGTHPEGDAKRITSCINALAG
ncbi:hypothetical protein LCGC14_1974890, partial [marine sediment metagenome]